MDRSTTGTNNEPINSAIMLNGVAHFTLSGHNLDCANVISGSRRLCIGPIRPLCSRFISLQYLYRADGHRQRHHNTPEMVLTGNGSISDSSLIFFGGNNSSVPRIDVSGERSDLQTLTLAGGQIFARSGPNQRQSNCLRRRSDITGWNQHNPWYYCWLQSSWHPGSLQQYNAEWCHNHQTGRSQQ